jgi:hypothetical protein
MKPQKCNSLGQAWPAESDSPMQLQQAHHPAHLQLAEDCVLFAVRRKNSWQDLKATWASGMKSAGRLQVKLIQAQVA